MTPERPAVLLDTDIGTNIDDALALGYLLAEPRCELLGVTTTGCQPERRAALARRLCDACGRTEVPVLAGYPTAERLGGRDVSPWLAGSAGPAPGGSVQEPGRAIAFLAETISRRPGRVTLITTGPLTNAASLLDAAPEAAGRLGRVVSMCGLFGDPPPGYGVVETNAGLDPAAAARVFGARFARHDVFGLEITGAHHRPAAEVAGRLGARTPELLRSLLGAWTGRNAQVRFHDPMTAVSVFEPDLFRFEQAQCSVDLSSPFQAGRTTAARDGGPHHLLTAVDFDRFLARLMRTITSV